MKPYVYKWTHEDGRYYIGVHKGHLGYNYIGSGKRFRASYDKDPSKWAREIIGHYLTYDQALAQEAALVTEETLKDDLCVNLKPGGEGGGSPQSAAAARKRLLNRPLNAYSVAIYRMTDPYSLDPQAPSNSARGLKSDQDVMVAEGVGACSRYVKWLNEEFPSIYLNRKALRETATGKRWSHKGYYAVLLDEDIPYKNHQIEDELWFLFNLVE